MYDVHIIEHGMWVGAYNNKTNNLEYIPITQICRMVDLGKSSDENKK